MKEKSKVSIMTLVLVCIIVVILSVAVMYCVMTKVQNNPAKVNNEQSVVSKIDTIKDYVYEGIKTDDVSSSEGNYVSGGHTVKSIIPVINLNSSEVNIINQNIENKIRIQTLENLKVNNDKYGSYYVQRYQYSVVDNIISLVIISRNKGVGTTYNTKYETYNIDIKTGKQIFLLEYLSRKNIELTKLEQDLKVQISEVIDDKSGMDPMISEKTNGIVNDERDYFINSKGELILVLDMKSDNELYLAYEYNSVIKKATFEDYNK